MKARARIFILSSWVLDLALIAICSLPLLFWRLGDLPITLWDESRLANNAIEMSRDGLDLVTTYLGHPDLWNTKPPLLIWLMATSFDLFGPSVWALRLPSALASLATAGIVYWFCRSVTGNRAMGVVGSLVMLTTGGFVAPHVARTGDYDALLVFFTTVIFTCCYRILEGIRLGAKPSSGLLVCTSLMLTGAIMTKGIAGILVLPGIALASFARGAIREALADWRVWLAVCMPLVVAGGFYLTREAAGGGYLEAVWENELGGRFMGSLEGHSEPALFYVSELFRPWNGDTKGLYLASAVPWSWLALILLPFAARDERSVPVLTYLLIVLVVFIVVISTAQTKISWYVAPAYPLIACLVTISSFAVLRHAFSAGPIPVQRRAALLMACLFALVAAILGSWIVGKNRAEVSRARINPELQSAAFLRGVMLTLLPGDRIRIVRARKDVPSLVSPAHTEYSPQEEFYASLMRAHGVDAQVVTPDYRSRRGDMLAWCAPVQPKVPEISRDLLASRGPCHLVRVIGAGPLEPGR